MSEAVWVALIAGLTPSLVVAVTAVLNRKKLEAIHVLVNSRFSAATATIAELRAEIVRLQAVLDRGGVTKRTRGKG